MNKTRNNMAIIPCVCLLLCYGCVSQSSSHGREDVSSEISLTADSLPESDNDTISQQEDIFCQDRDAKKIAILASYPDMVKDIHDNKVFFSDSSFITYDDNTEKDFVTMLDESDVEDMFYVPYRLPEKAPEYLEDAGRSRSEALFKKMYGASESAVRKNLVNVDWFGQNVTFSSINGAADSLKAVRDEIAKYPELRPILKSSGTFYWRTVRGSKRQSAHSYGIAIDVGVDKADYWQWNAKTNEELSKFRYNNRMPLKLVEIFERHGFIWGGAWYHYDTMHFEFRPEILHYGRLAAAKQLNRHVPMDN